MRGRVTEGRLNLDEVAMLFSYACMVGNDGAGAGAGSLGTLSGDLVWGPCHGKAPVDGICRWQLEGSCHWVPVAAAYEATGALTWT